MKFVECAVIAPETRPKAGGIDYSRELNPQQLEAVFAPDGPALVLAGAGSGKTRVVTYRVARLLETGIKPEEILLLTFTKKASEEMLRRAGGLVRFEAARLWGGTFHHVANLVLRLHAAEVGLLPDYSILDRDDSKALLDTLVREAGYDTRRGSFPKGGLLLETIGYAESTCRGLEDAVRVKCPQYEKLSGEIVGIASLYARRKRLRNYLDFEDLLGFFARLLRERPDTAASFRERFRHILVDEYQDTNALQAALVRNLAGERLNVMAVGDDAQSIYSFRGAAYRNIRDFPRDYPGCRVYTVETNYRSTPEILALTNQVLKNSDSGFRKHLRPTLSSGPLPILVRPNNVYDQARFVADRLSELIGAGAAPGEIAVLYRSHYHSMEIQMELTRRGIPFTVRSGLRFFAQAHVKDVLAYLKIVDNPRDEVSWKRVLVTVPRLGPRSAEKVWQGVEASGAPLADLAAGKFAESVPAAARAGFARLGRTLSGLKEKDASEPGRLIGRILKGEYAEYLQSAYSNCSNRVDDIRQLQSYAAAYGDLHSFLEELAMTADVPGEEEPSRPAGTPVVLSSVHQAKGLEWNVVFVVWLAEGRFPAGPSYNDSEAMEEERRLFYVAATRCRRELYLLAPLTARNRDGYGETPLAPSRFLTELDGEVYDNWDFYDLDL